MSDKKNSKWKYYDLMMFPYPSGTAMHVGHASNYLYSEITARFRRMQWYDVIFPLGYDSFGLPTENFAIKNNVSAKEATDNNIKYFEEQVTAMNFSLDKDRMFLTSNSEYYKWTQWIFAKLFEHGLAYRKDGFVNWCNGCQTVLANDQVVDGRCERCETEIIQKKQPQRYIKITDYAEHLLDYSDCDRPAETIQHQKNRIGKSHGAEINFDIYTSDNKNNLTSRTITVFTTRPDTIYGVTAVVLAPENDILDNILESELGTPSEYLSNLQKYRAQVAKETNITRQAEGREKTGIFSGIYVLHPLTWEKVPVRYADYVLPDYATGSVMMVPAHDIRDWEFAEKFEIASVQVIWNQEYEQQNTWLEESRKKTNEYLWISTQPELPYTGKWVLVNSWQFDCLDNIEAKAKITEYLESIGKWKTKTTYRLRDWSVSRQRYRWSPIPVYYTFPENEDGKYTVDNPHPDKSKWIPNLISYDQLPVILPLDLPNYKPAGKSPLEDHPSFKYYHFKDWNIYLRECDTLDTFMCSSFYYLRFLDPQNNDELISAEAMKNMPVDLYIWGKEHTVGHLLYSRFIYKFLKDKWYIYSDSKEPFRKLVHQGMVSASDGRKMSKRRWNVIDPMDTIRQFGSDTLRTYIMFMWPIELNKNRNPEAVAGISKFLARVNRASETVDADLSAKDDAVSSAAHIAIKWVSEDLQNLKFNTAVSKLMILINAIYDAGKVSNENFENLLLLLSPFATDLTQELWTKLGHDDQISSQSRPTYKSEYILSTKINLAVQINGKMRWTLELDRNLTEYEVIEKMKSSGEFDKYMTGEIRKIIYVQDKICNIMIG